MPYYVVSDWRNGLDFRRDPIATEPGALIALENAHITPGGDIEKRYTFLEQGTDVLANTHGLSGLSGAIFVYDKSPLTPPGLTKYVGGPIVPGTIYYMELTGGSATAIQKIEDWEIFDGKLWVVALLINGTYERYYDGAFVSDGGAAIHTRTFQSKVYGVETKNLHFCALDDPTTWTPTVPPAAQNGAGTVNLSTQDADAYTLTGIEIYYDQMALFSENAVQFWSVDPDPLLNRQVQVLRSTGTLANHSPRQFADGDVLYLATSGVRSLRARNSSNSASVSDIGSPIDKLIQDEYVNNLAEFREAISLVDPRTGRFWLIIGDTIYVLSYFPATDVTAWSIYKPGFTTDCAAIVGQRIYLRDETKLYNYGGIGGTQYDNSTVTVRTPMFYADQPATWKNFTAFDAVGRGAWNVGALFDPRLAGDAGTVYEPLGLFQYPTYAQPSFAMQGFSTHVGFELTSNFLGETTLSQLAFHYSLAKAT